MKQVVAVDQAADDSSEEYRVMCQSEQWEIPVAEIVSAIKLQSQSWANRNKKGTCRLACPFDLFGCGERI